MNNQQLFFESLWRDLLWIKPDPIFKIRHASLNTVLEELIQLFRSINFHRRKHVDMPYRSHKKGDRDYEKIQHRYKKPLISGIDEILWYLSRASVCRSKHKGDIEAFELASSLLRTTLLRDNCITPTQASAIFKLADDLSKKLKQDYHDLLIKNISSFVDGGSSKNILKDFEEFDSCRKNTAELIGELIRMGFSVEFLSTTFNVWMNKIRDGHEKNIGRYFSKIILGNVSKEYVVHLRIRVNNDFQDLFHEIIEKEKSFEICEEVSRFAKLKCIDSVLGSGIRGWRKSDKLYRLEDFCHIRDGSQNNGFVTRFLSKKIKGTDYTAVNYRAFVDFKEIYSLIELEKKKGSIEYEASLIFCSKDYHPHVRNEITQRIQIHNRRKNPNTTLRIAEYLAAIKAGTNVNEEDKLKLINALRFYKTAVAKDNPNEEFILLWFALEQLFTNSNKVKEKSIISRVSSGTESLIGYTTFKDAIFEIAGHIRRVDAAVLAKCDWVIDPILNLTQIADLIRDDVRRKKLLAAKEVPILLKYKIIYYYEHILKSHASSISFFKSKIKHQTWNIKRMYFYRNQLAHNGGLNNADMHLLCAELRELVFIVSRKIISRFHDRLNNPSSYIQNINGLVCSNAESLDIMLLRRGGMINWYKEKDKDRKISAALWSARIAGKEYERLVKSKKT